MRIQEVSSAGHPSFKKHLVASTGLCHNYEVASIIKNSSERHVELSVPQGI